jgi:lipooligosaccharide transport system permease protein
VFLKLTGRELRVVVMMRPGPFPSTGEPALVPVWRRSLRVWRKLAGPRWSGIWSEPLLYLVAGLWAGVAGRLVQGMPTSSFSLRHRLCQRHEHRYLRALYPPIRAWRYSTWAGMLAAPLSVDDILLGEVIWAGSRASSVYWLSW